MGIQYSGAIQIPQGGFKIVKAITGDQYWSNVITLLQDTFDDLSNDGRTVTAAGSSAIVAGGVFGDCIFLPNAASDVVTISGSFLFENDFTFEGWFKTTGDDKSLFVTTNGSQYFAVNYDATNTQYNLYLNSSTPSYTIPFTQTDWTHVAMCRSGNSLKLFANGTNIWEITHTNSLGFASTAFTRLGGGFSGNLYADDVRITEGVARYTSNFSIPTEAFPTA